MPVKHFNPVLFFLLLFSVPVTFAQTGYYTSPVPLYMLVDAKTNFPRDNHIWYYDEYGNYNLVTKVNESPEEIALYCGGILRNPPHAFYMERTPGSVIYPWGAEFLGYLAYPYPVSQEALNQSPVDLPMPYEDFGSILPDAPVVCRFVYVMVAPWKPTTPSEGGIVCANETLTVRTDNNKDIPMGDSYVENVMVFEYNVADSAEWIPYDSAGMYWDGAISSVYPQDKIASVRNATIKKKLRFRCRQKAAYLNGKIYYSPYSQPTGYLEIHPPAPSVDVSRIVKTAACPTENNGTITVPSGAVKSNFSRMRWILRKGLVTTPCDPGLTAGQSNCGDQEDWSNGSVPVEDVIHVDNLKPGTYTLWVYNPGQDEGNCVRYIPITIDELAPLSVTTDAAKTKNLSCYNSNDGTIGVTAAGSNTSGTYYFTLLSGTNVVRAEQTGTGNTMLWENLPAGTYQARVRNSSCSSVALTGDIIVTQPAALTGELIATSPTCTSPGNGMVSVTANANGGIISNYAFNLYKDNVLVLTSGPVSADTYVFTDLEGGNYKAGVINNDQPLCPSWDSSVTLTTLVPLAVKLTARDSVSCFGGNDGQLEFSAVGGTGLYLYTLESGGVSVSNTTGVFPGLSAGNYTITVKNQGNTCNDEVVQNIAVYQRTAINIQLQQTPLSCYGLTDASIKAIVSGGSGNFYYQWQQLKNGVWTDNSFWFSTDTQIEDLDAGTYRLIIKDNLAPACTVTSTPMTIDAITPVQINNINVHDAVCKADGAQIEMTAEGGVPGYVYEWSVDNTNWQAFPGATTINASGNYRLRVTDAHHCMVTSPSTYAVSIPNAPLSFTYTLSDYKGYNVSCAGKTDGFIQVTVAGGNGGSYSGYAYALDNGAYGVLALLEHIAAGTHTINVKDGRGCVMSKTVTLTAPASELEIMVTSKQHNGCGADPVGQISVQSKGGTAPYAYSHGNDVWQDSPVLTGIAAGDYTLQVRDANGCISDVATTLTSIYPPITVAADVTPVTCHGLSDGAITLTAGGGDGNYAYQWATTGVSGSAAKNIPAGVYAVEVKDGTGCKQALTYTVTQPEPLTLQVAAPGICDGLNEGSITATVTGGTSPYQYSLDKSSWLAEGTFGGLPTGKYRLDVRDANKCLAGQDVTITKLNIKPEVDFLVASRKNALDTLLIREISLPAPDQVSWSYHPDAIFLGTVSGAPLIRFSKAGTYWVEMAATFGDCTYSLRKELTIGAYDPQAGPGYSTPVKVIDTVVLAPNPNNGNFNYTVKLNRKQQMIVYVYDMNGAVADKKKYAPALEVNDSFTLNGVITGTYILRVIAESESKDVRFIITR
ncbi:T9SS type A sorting domain-containing protein [Chitinophaga tropicalis]|uniref:T9SS type A sorting domain-containing protein n=1 Tax=Chitinophaga tropicalis TaxID=2683588 RepID=A0A7K1U1I8_9BACT|nr:T9SS type A sorting domain-containing protein [Chitinophaga tropicalis]MVT08146.1 T9SS type A sorting domain-containing protein [Chitinophaga tropicalis]